MTLTIIGIIVAVAVVLAVMWHLATWSKEEDPAGPIVKLDQASEAPYKIEAPVEQQKVETVEQLVDVVKQTAVKKVAKPKAEAKTDTKAPVRKKRTYTKKNK